MTSFLTLDMNKKDSIVQLNHCLSSFLSSFMFNHDNVKSKPCSSNHEKVNPVMNTTFRTKGLSMYNKAQRTSILWIYFLLLFSILSSHSIRTSSAIRTIQFFSSSSPNIPDKHHNYSRSTPISSPICRQDKSDCSSQQESDYFVSGGLRLNTILGDPMRKIYTEFNDYSRRFDDIIRELIKNSEQGFQAMFSRTYGQRYERHSSLFDNMFIILTNYYSSNNLNLDSELNKFFVDLYKKMFAELNAHYSFNDDYLKCVGSHMETVNPFGDNPRKLLVEVQRSFTAARVFKQSLVSVADISKSISEHSATPNCQKYFIQMNYCQKCELNSIERTPCRNYCNTVMSICTHSYRFMNKEWNPFIDKLSAIIDRLETSFNIESVVSPLNIKISEAIMNFQENGLTISKKLYSICGKPKRGKRRAINRRPSPSLTTIENSSTSTSKSPIESFLDDTKKQLRKLKDFWIRLPETICNNSIIPQSNEFSSEFIVKPCWNQTDGTTQPLIDKSDEMYEKIQFINSHKISLRNINSKLDAAYRGSDIPEDEDLSAGGSGSGDGDYDEDDYTDDYNENDDDENENSTENQKSSTSTVNPLTSTEKTIHDSNPVNQVNKTDNQSAKHDPINESSTIIRQQSTSHQSKDSSSVIKKSTKLIISFTILSILVGQNL